MEKLLQLLNEFYPVDGWDKEYYIEKSKVYVRDYDDDDIFNYEIFTLNIISKKFGFIQWLVVNDKTKEVEYGLGYTSYSESDNLIRLLSIQDDPISFLVSLLK